MTSVESIEFWAKTKIQKWKGQLRDSVSQMEIGFNLDFASFVLLASFKPDIKAISSLARRLVSRASADLPGS